VGLAQSNTFRQFYYAGPNMVRRQVLRTWTVMDTIRQTKLQLFGHIDRMPVDRLLKPLIGVRDGGRGKTTRTTCVEIDRQHCDVVVRSRRPKSTVDDR